MRSNGRQCIYNMRRLGGIPFRTRSATAVELRRDVRTRPTHVDIIRILWLNIVRSEAGLSSRVIPYQDEDCYPTWVVSASGSSGENQIVSPKGVGEVEEGPINMFCCIPQEYTRK